MKIASQLIEVFKSLMPSYNSSEGIYEYGNGNSYPEYIKWLIDNSITAHTASNMMTNFVAGKPFENPNDDRFINKLNEFKRKLAKQITDYKGWAINVQYNANGDIAGFKVMPFHHCRIGKKDDRNYNAKILAKSNWGDSEENPDVFDVYNRDKKVIEAQILTQGNKYKGQLYFGSIDDISIYPNSRIHPVINDCESEIQAGQFKQKSFAKGFFGKLMIVTPPFVNSLLPKGTEEWKEATDAKEKFKKNMRKFSGVDGIGSFMHFEMEFDNEEDVNKKILFKMIPSDIDPKMFEPIEKGLKENIAMAFNNIPKVLIANPDSAFFGQSGESFKQAQLIYQSNTEQERNLVESILNSLLKGMNKETVNIQPLIEKPVQNGE